MPVYCIVSPGKDAADFFAQEAKHMELLGDEIMELNQKSITIIRKIDIKTGRPRPDLLDISKKE